jgi:hypothetical protein
MAQGVSDETSGLMTVSPEHHFYHDLEGGTSLTTTLVLALAEVQDVEVQALGFTLYDHVDPDALDSIFTPQPDGSIPEGRRIELTIADHSVTVHGDGHIVVTEDPSPPFP